MSASSSHNAAGAMPRVTTAERQTRSRTVDDPSHLLPDHASEPGGRRPGSRRRLIIVLLIVLAIIGFIVWRIHSNNVAAEQQAARQAAAASRPTPVQVTAVPDGPMSWLAGAAACATGAAARVESRRPKARTAAPMDPGVRRRFAFVLRATSRRSKKLLACSYISCASRFDACRSPARLSPSRTGTSKPEVP